MLLGNLSTGLSENESRNNTDKNINSIFPLLNKAAGGKKQHGIMIPELLQGNSCGSLYNTLKEY
jgi:hypothetical protein